MPVTSYTNIPGGVARAPFGGVTLYIDGVAYRALNYKPDTASRAIRRNDSNGDQAEIMRRAEPRSQSGLTLQIATKSTALPPLFAEFTDPIDGATVMVVDKVSPSRPEGEFWVCDIDISANTP
ncbi:MAG TPA: hypothetical protein VLH79_06850 [Chthonomonadales bacterium]|nr:hypothetical protein [Chthonomonadales bacterium]